MAKKDSEKKQKSNIVKITLPTNTNKPNPFLVSSGNQDKPKPKPDNNPKKPPK